MKCLFMRPFSVWQYATVCYACLVNHARSTESKQKYRTYTPVLLRSPALVAPLLPHCLRKAVWGLLGRAKAQNPACTFPYVRVNPLHKQLLNTGTQETGARRIGRGFDRSFVRSGTRGERNPLFINMTAEKSRFCFYSVPIARIYREAQPTGKTLPVR